MLMPSPDPAALLRIRPRPPSVSDSPPIFDAPRATKPNWSHNDANRAAGTASISPILRAIQLSKSAVRRGLAEEIIEEEDSVCDKGGEITHKDNGRDEFVITHFAAFLLIALNRSTAAAGVPP
jgi:hypothetical protein